MADETTVETQGHEEAAVTVRHRRPVPRLIGLVLIGLLIFLVAVALILWTQRRPLATDIVKRELERRGVVLRPSGPARRAPIPVPTPIVPVGGRSCSSR